MAYFIGVQDNDAKKFTYTYSNITANELSTLVDTGMQAIGYKHKGNGVYEKGSRVKRLLMGALTQYFKCQVALNSADNQQHNVTLIKKTTGWSGGLIGVKQVKDEMNYLKKVLQAL